jgi:CRISPR-associated protein Csm3
VVGITDGSPLSFAHIKDLPEGDRKRAKAILRLFGGAPEGVGENSALVQEIGPARLAFWDCGLDSDWIDEMRGRNLLLTETKMENTIDRIRGVALNPRNSERVPAGARFDFALTIRVHDNEDLMPIVYEGIRLLELTGLGGSSSRGYGKVRMAKLDLDGQNVLPELAKVSLSEVA